ncbi:MAG: phosphoribosyl transferase [Verrucomicrobia bacterium]|nr:phosphoribosyl transferase [Verrucomicrobiota bacterium]
MIFKDRADAGRKLAQALVSYKGQDAIVYALPRGGVVLGAEIARVLDAPLDLIVVRKVGHPHSPEYAIAAVAEDGHAVVNRLEVNSIDKKWFDERVRVEQQEARRRRELYTRGRDPIPAKDKVAIIVDDGLATGLTMFAAIQEIRHFLPKKVVVAVPVAPPRTVQELKRIVDDVIALYVTDDFGAIGSFYLHFAQVSDEEVIDLLKLPAIAQPGRSRDV